MNIFSTILILGCFATHAATGQGIIPYQSKWQIRPSFGVNRPLTKLLDGRNTDPLIKYSDHSSYWQLFSGTWFFHKRWGVEANLQAMTARNIPKGPDRFTAAIESEYQDKYFVDASTRHELSESDIFLYFRRAFIGVIYRTEISRFIIHPKISLGINSFDTYWGKAILKQRNANNVYELHYEPEKTTNNYVTVAASTALGYKISKWVFVNIDLMASHYKTDINFVKKFTDLNTNLSTTENIQYKKGISTFTVGGGLIFVMR